MTNNNRKNCHTIFKNCCSRLYEPKEVNFQVPFSEAVAFWDAMIKHWDAHKRLLQNLLVTLLQVTWRFWNCQTWYISFMVPYYFVFIFKDVEIYLKSNFWRENSNSTFFCFNIFIKDRIWIEYAPNFTNMYLIFYAENIILNTFDDFETFQF